ncbi:hypothetical protein EUZ85_21805 [Hahella sp. KA22]|uniref:hypothetical protein n=1 Tax=Hahella sp. KA22 TaxID=1628392 RepID=UPI000FDE08CB|nr:hypothetical protein [Hahella sp. KA22]AZZ93212.1 hypothetical protein ENC22_19225 [Hahella sp. KA22]QAY56586.1 hypothetical protein EUZ85_21805 [Hahella sp. KA22]
MPASTTLPEHIQSYIRRSLIDREYIVGGGADKNDALSHVVGSTNLVKVDIIDRFNLYNSSDREVYYRGHEEEKELLEEIVRDWKSYKFNNLRLTGHSWGGQAVMNITQKLFVKGVPVKELITLDPVSMLPLARPQAEKWVNVYIRQSILDNTIGKLPLVNQVVSSVASLPTLLTVNGRAGGYIANIGSQLGHENGAYNYEMDVSHANAGEMYKKALSLLEKAPTSPKAMGVR